MNKKLYRVLRDLLVLVFLFSTVMLLRDLLEYRAGEQTYEDAARTAGLTRPAVSHPRWEAVSPDLPRKRRSRRIWRSRRTRWPRWRQWIWLRCGK